MSYIYFERDLEETYFSIKHNKNSGMDIVVYK